MDEEVAESWEEAADSGVNDKRHDAPPAQGERTAASFFVFPRRL